MPFYAGKEAQAIVGGVTYHATDWEIEVESTEIDVTNMESPEVGGETWREFLGGFTKGMATLKGIFDPTLAKPVGGAATTYSFKVGSTHTISGAGVTLKRRFNTGIEDAAKFDFSLRMTGAPTFT